MTTTVTSLNLASGAVAESYRARGVVGLPADARMKIAAGAEPLWVEAERENQVLADLVRETCGEQGRVVNSYLANRAAEINRLASPDALVPKGEAVAVPMCFKVDRKIKVRVEEGDTISDLLKRHYGVFGPVTQRQVYELNAEAYEGVSPEEFPTSLRPGTELVLPYASEARTLVWRSGGEGEAKSLAALLSSLPRLELREPFETSLESVEPEPDPYRFRGVPLVEPESARVACEGRRLVSVMELVIERFGVESQVATRRLGRVPSPTIVGIVDTGLERNDQFFESILEINIREKEGRSGVDDDYPPNGYVDDVFGVRLDPRDNWIYSSGTDESPGHGTKIATVVAAGPEFETWLKLVEESPVRLKFVSYSSELPRSGIDPSLLSEAPSYLKSAGARVVNMSLSSRSRPLPFTNALAATPELLLVVAAGNARDGEGRELGPFALYPALYGGRSGQFSRNVITVGAHDVQGRRARFSNFSRELVDILAPGCSVVTRDRHGNPVAESGTSVATAIVSFAAALVRSLGVQEPWQIKNRLLVASDFDPALAAAVWSSGRLNIVKAISVSHDVVESAEGLHFGRVRNREQFLNLCRVRPVPPLERVRRLIPNLPAGEGGLAVEYWIEPDERLYRRSCEQTQEAVEVELETSDGVRRISLSSVRDLTFAME